MRSIWAIPATFRHSSRIHPALRSLAGECRRTLAHLAAYVGVLASLAIIGIHLWGDLPAGPAPEHSAQAGWSLATRSYPAFALSMFDIFGKTETYEIFRRPEGGRKDVLQWLDPGEKPVAELEIYRPGGESGQSGPAVAEMASRMAPEGRPELEGAGVIESKFGTVALLHPSGTANQAMSCLGFVKYLDGSSVRLSGWSCQGDTLPAQRTAIACMLDRLVLLTSGNEPKLAELFAHAELKRRDCALAGLPVTSADWVTGAQNPKLRGAL
jgi:hypothetical protein